MSEVQVLKEVQPLAKMPAYFPISELRERAFQQRTSVK